MKKFYPFLIVSTLIMLVYCAHQGMPPGGPDDKQPPRVLFENLIPPAGTTGVALDTDVEISFNESVDRLSVEDAFFMSPYPRGGLKFKWKRKKLILKFPEGLEPHRTYVITIGTDTKDMRQNRMKESFTMAFATGDSIDQGIITGRVQAITGSVAGTQIWAYALDDSLVPNPQFLEADYITQCSESGSYSLPYLALDSYRLFAIVDKDLNRIYDPEYDLIGICTKDAHLNSKNLQTDECNFQLTRQDTTRPGLYKVYAPDNRHLSIRFDETISKSNTDSTGLVLIQQLRNNIPVDTLQILEMYHNTYNPSRLELITAPQVPDGTYRVSVEDFYDSWSNPVEPEYSTIDFIGSANSDTIRPQIVLISPQDSTKNIALDQKTEFVFSEYMNDSSVYRYISYLDTTGQQTQGKYIKLAPNLFQFVGDTKWASMMEYQILIQADSIYDKFGNSLGDSSIQFIFTTLNADTLSSIQGIILDELESDSGRIFMKATQTRQNGNSYEIQVEKPGEYNFESIFPGDYVISGFRDRDGNGEYSFGRIKPWLPAERFFVYSDTINVRSRWPSNEGNDIMIAE